MLSPHPDDAALSLGGALTAGLLPAPITVVTVFDRSNFASRERRGALAAVTAMRAEEDQRFCVGVGAQLKRLGLSDACVRHPERHVADLFTVLKEPSMQAEVNARLDELVDLHPAALVMAPLAVGGHVDHRLVSDAARAGRWHDCVFYADQPYALRAGTKPARPLLIVPQSSSASALKLRAAAAYGSQPAVGDLAELLSATPDGTAVEWVTCA